MDPQSRRDTWEVIREARKDCIVILTTHYMDEAEALADRVAIISRGKLQTCGSSLFLKQKYSKGFFLEIERENTQETGSIEPLETLLASFAEKAEVPHTRF